MFKKMKKLQQLLLCCLMAVCISGCGLEEDQNLQALLQKAEEEETSEDLIVIGFSQPGAESGWRVALTDSVRETFTEEAGYKLIYKDGKSKQDNQIKDIRTFILQGVDYIILSPIVETGWDSVLEEAKEAGIPVIICDRNVQVSNESLYTAFVGSDFETEGKSAVSYIERMLAQKQKDAETEEDSEYQERMNIVLIEGTLGSSAQLGRSAELLSAVEKYDTWNIIAEDSGEFTKAKSREIMSAVLEEYSAEDIDLVYCENDEEAFGVMAALNDKGISYGIDGDVAIISFDGTSMALEMTMAGLINYEVECNPLQGQSLLSIVEQLEAGKAVPKITYISETTFTQNTLSKEYLERRKY